MESFPGGCCMLGGVWRPHHPGAPPTCRSCCGGHL